tara:strand:- start:32691 stop:33029 length:339 start_codon:yes stop_codon:yes gene_type:complete
MANISEISVTASVTIDGMGDGWANEDEAAEAYAEWLTAELTEHLESQYPNAEIEVNCPVLNQMGGDNVSVVIEDGEDGYPYDIQESLQNFCQDCWAHWICDEKLTAGLIAED